MCDTYREDTYICVCVRIYPAVRNFFFFHLGSQSPIKLSRAFYNGAQYMYMLLYHSRATFIFSLQPSLMLPFIFFLNPSLSLTVSASGSRVPYLFCLTLSCQAHNFICLCVCGVGQDCSDIGMTYEAGYKVRRRHLDVAVLDGNRGDVKKAPAYQRVLPDCSF